MASTNPAMLSSRPVQSQVAAYLSPFCTEQYQTITPRRFCLTDSLANFMMSRELELPFSPSRIRSLGTSTCGITQLERGGRERERITHLDRESLPLF